MRVTGIDTNSRAFNIGDFSSGKAQQPLPKSLAGSEHGIDYFAVLCRKLCIKLLRHFARGLMVWAMCPSYLFLSFMDGLKQGQNH